MKLKIGNLEFEGTPEEINALMLITYDGAKERSMPDARHTIAEAFDSDAVRKHQTVRRGQPAKILAGMFAENPSMMSSGYEDIRAAYIKRTGVAKVNALYLRKNIQKAAKLAARRKKKARWASVEEKQPADCEKIRTIVPYGYIRRQMIEDIIRKLPGTFSFADVMRRVAEKTNTSYNNSRFIHYGSVRRHIRHICGQHTIKGYGGPNTRSSVFNNPYNRMETLDSVMKLKPIEDNGYADFKPVPAAASEDPYVPVVISQATMDMLFNSYQSFGADALVGLKSKTDAIMNENDAKFCFRHMLENISGVQRLYPNNRISISGSGQYKSIEVRG
jgi:hypothetical protein